MAVKKTATKPATNAESNAIKPIAKKSISNYSRKKACPEKAPYRKPPKAEKAMKQIFHGLVMSFSGTFMNCDKVAPHEQVSKWITSHGAEYEKEVTDYTTHLICSIEDFRTRKTQVQKAWKLGGKCRIVVFDWIVDCLRGPRDQKRLRAEKPYTLDRTITRLKQGKKAIEAYRRRFDEGVKASKELCDGKLNHVYYDADGFEYKILMTRINMSGMGGKIYTEKYTLFLFESNAKPHTYMCGAKFNRPGRPTALYNAKCQPKTFPEAFEIFTKIFREKTGKDWDMRVERCKAQTKSPFVYVPPALGRPIGLMPPEYVRPELREEESEGTGSGVGSGSEEDVAYDTDSEVDEEEDSSSERICSEEAEQPGHLSMRPTYG